MTRCRPGGEMPGGRWNQLDLEAAVRIKSAAATTRRRPHRLREDGRQLMGNKPGERFNFISEGAEFVSEEGLDI